jgi:SAM-dependent methyltransferase
MSSPPAHSPSPPERLLQAAFGAVLTRCLTTIAELGVADALANGPLPLDALAKNVGSNADFLNRVMRVLVATGVADEPTPGVYAQTAVTDLLRRDHPQSMRDLVILLTAESHWAPLGKLADALRSGQSGARHAFGVDVWDWFQRPENKGEWDLFNAAMTSFSMGTSAAVAESFDFKAYKRIVDVGGGHGFLLRTILSKAPSATGVLCDLPGVVGSANRSELGDRIERFGADFFERVPEGGDCYVLKHIIHDWDDAHCQRVLGNIARSMAPDGRVLIVDMVLPKGHVPHPSLFLDIVMIDQTVGGRERTEQEFDALLSSAGLSLVAIHPTPSPVSVVEARKA